MLKKLIVRLILITFFFTSIGPLPDVSAQSMIDLPAPGMMINKSIPYQPLELKGILVNIKNPLRFDFLVDKGDSSLHGQPLKDEITRLAKYFLTCLTVPEDDLWVNLSPYEKDRIVPGNFGITLMGKDLLEQDYLLKQIMASLSYPESDLGKRFWQRVYKRSYELYGTTEIPINTFNKVWIFPKSADVYAMGNSAFVVKSQLDVMLEADYKVYARMKASGFSQNTRAYSQVFRDVILPELRQEINRGKNFAVVRQVYNAMILATWYKRHLKDSLLSRMYVGKNKVLGVDIADKDAKEKIFQQYLKAYKRCVYNYIKEDYDQFTQQTVPRKYASGGVDFEGFSGVRGTRSVYAEVSDAQAMTVSPNLAMATIDLTALNQLGEGLSLPDMRAVIDYKHPFYQVPLEVYNASKPLNNQAMAVRKFLRTMALPLALAVGGFFMAPTTVSAATPVAIEKQVAANPAADKEFNDIQNNMVAILRVLNDHRSFLGLRTGWLGAVTSEEESKNLEGFYSGITRMNELLGQVHNMTPEQRVLLEALNQFNDLFSPDSIKYADARHFVTVGLRPGQGGGGYQHYPERVNAFFDKADQLYDTINFLLSGMGPESITPLTVAQSVPVQPNVVSLESSAFVPPTAPTQVLAVTPPPVQEIVPLETAPQTTTAPNSVPFTSIADNIPDSTPSNANSVPSGSPPPPPVVLAPAALPVASTVNVQTAALPVVVTSSTAPSVSATVTAADTQPKSVDLAPDLPTALPVSMVPPSNVPPVAAPPIQPIVPAVTSQTSAPIASGGSPPPPDDHMNFDILQYVQGQWPLYLGAAILGIGMGYWWGSRTKSRKQINNVPRPKPKVYMTPPSFPLPVKEGVSAVDVTLPPPMASSGESGILKEDLANLRAVANGTMQPSPPIPAEEDDQSGQQNLWWMHVGALIAGAGLSWCLDGGISWTVGMIPLLTGGFYALQKWLHEMSHLVPAAVLYHPKNLSTTFSKNNLQGNLSLGQWIKTLIPFQRTRRSYVDLPFAGSEGGWLNYSRNLIVRGSGQAGTVILTLTAGYFMGLTPLLAPLVLSALAVTKGSVESGDWSGSQDTDEGRFGCGIIGFIKKVPLEGVRKKTIRPWLGWIFKGVENSLPRGGQQAGGSTNFIGANGNFQQVDEKITKEKRNWKFWQTWDKGPVFYRNMIIDLHSRFYDRLPDKLVPVYNYFKFGVYKFLYHVRFATLGDMVAQAAHPHSSPEEEREQWVYDFVQGKYRKVNRIFNVTSAFNGDHDGTNIGVPEGSQLIGTTLGTAQMRSYFSAAVHKYYDKRITIRYLMATVSDGQKYRQKVKTNYWAVLNALYKKGYVSSSGFVNRRFVDLDKEFRGWFPDYREEVFNEIKSALFGMPPGDAPILSVEQHFALTQGCWWASMRYAYDSLQEARGILFEREGRAVGSVFSEVYDQVQPFLSRRGYTPDDPEKVRSLSDQYVRDEATAKRLGLESQFQMIKIFKEMLEKRMIAEAEQQTLAGQVFRKILPMRRSFIDVAVEKFFTADNIAATKEFADRADGSHGLFMQSPLDDSITLYQNNQDVVIGYNEEAGVIAFGSDPRSLKYVGPAGERVNKVMPLKDGEIVNIAFSPSGKVVIKSWIKSSGQWNEIDKDELEARTYPTAEYVNGRKNEYYAPPPVEYDSPRRIPQEDLQNIPKILSKAQAEWEDPGSFNSQSIECLTQRISEVIKKNGKARLLIVGYDNSRKLSEHLKDTFGDLVDDSRLIVDIADSNKFSKSPSKFNVRPDDIVMMISKSGATFSTRLALRIIKKMVYQENIFCMTARIDSVLNTMIGQGLRPGIDKFTKHVFITGEFYPAETPVASEVLLEFQLQQLAVNLARGLGRVKDPGVLTALKIPPDRLEMVSRKITDDSLRLVQEITGYDLNGDEYADKNKDPQAIGNYLGKTALETFYVNWIKRLFVAGVLSSPLLLAGQYIGGGLLGTAINVIWICEIFPFFATVCYRKLMGRPAFGRASPFGLFIAGPPMLHSTQRNFLSRILTNRPGSIGPRAIHSGDATTDFVADHASDQVRGDITLRFALKHRENEGRMGVGQATYPQTAIISTNLFRGKPEKLDVIVEVFHDKDAGKDEINLMDNTVGTLGLMIAAKTIGVEMAKVASFDGRLFDLAYTFSSAGVHTTQINPITQEAKDILSSEKRILVNKAQAVVQREGGISMNSRLMQLNITGDTQNRITAYNEAMSGSLVKGVVPQVSGIVTVTPDMLKAMLGTGYLN